MLLTLRANGIIMTFFDCLVLEVFQSSPLTLKSLLQMSVD
jgi:hypothetical protein